MTSTYSLNPSIKRTSDNFSWMRLTLLFIAAILLVRTISLYFNPTDLFVDETQYWLWGKELDFGYFSKPPLLGWIIGLFTTLCGSDGEFCVRLASPVLHSITAWLIYLSARNMFDEKTGFWSALTFLTLPGITLSSSLISTDVPLLLCWSGALWMFIRFGKVQSWNNAVLMGLFIGFGLMAKYAMIYFVMCALIYALFHKPARRLVFNPKFLTALFIAVIILSPNIWWNVTHDFITTSHTKDNIGWIGDGLHPREAGEFLGAQFGVFGPFLFAFYLIAIVRFIFEGWSEEQKFLMLFSLPVLLLIVFQALMNDAYANWAAPTYVAASILVADLMVNKMPPIWRTVSFSTHGLILVAFILAIAYSATGDLKWPGNEDMFKRLHGWKAIAQLAQKQLKKEKYVAVIGSYRHLTSELVYYLRDENIPVFALKTGTHPADHYELTRPYEGIPDGPILLVSASQDIARIVPSFKNVYLERKIKLKTGTIRNLWLFKLEGYQNRK